MEYVMKNLILALTLFAISSPVFAGQADDIEACVKTLKQYTGTTVDEFDAKYESSWLTFNTVKWNGITCDVKLGSIVNLIENGKDLIYQGFSGKDSFLLNDKLEKETAEAIATMRSRITLLEERMSKSTKELQSFKPDHKKIEQYIKAGIKKAI